jgi:hypothetical protein
MKDTKTGAGFRPLTDRRTNRSRFRNRGNECRGAAFEFIDRSREVCFVEPPH